MRQRVHKTLKTFGWRQWLVAAAFVAVLGFTGLYAYRAVRDAIYWDYHTDEPIQSWMNVGYVAHSYHVPPHVLYSALGMPNRHDKRPLLKIAAAQGRSLDETKAILMDAIVHVRPPYPPPPPPPPPDESPTP